MNSITPCPPIQGVVIGLDPSMVATGYGVLKRGALVGAGDVRTDLNLGLRGRMEQLAYEVWDVICRARPEVIVVEFPSARKGGLYSYGRQSPILAASYGLAVASVYWAARVLRDHGQVLAAPADAWPGELVPRPPGTKGDPKKTARVAWVQDEYGVKIDVGASRAANVADAILLARWGEQRRSDDAALREQH